MVIVNAIGYASINFILSYNWYRFLKLISDETVSFMVYNYIYSLSSLAKYVPGSVLQYANRQMLGRVYNVS